MRRVATKADSDGIARLHETSRNEEEADCGLEGAACPFAPASQAHDARSRDYDMDHYERCHGSTRNRPCDRIAGAEIVRRERDESKEDRGEAVLDHEPQSEIGFPRPIRVVTLAQDANDARESRQRDADLGKRHEQVRAD